MKNSNHTPKQRLLALCLMLALLLSLLAGCKAPAEPEEDTETTVPATTEASKEMSFTDLMKAVFTLKGDLESAVEKIEENELAEAKALAEGLFAKTGVIRESLDVSIRNIGSERPSLTAQLENIQDILDLVDLAAEKLLLPVICQFQEYPFVIQKVGEGISTDLICDYLDFAGSMMPAVKSVMEKANAVDLSVFDSEGELAASLEGVNAFLELYQRDNTVIDKMKAMLGAQEDRVYLFAAQNSAEIRASGGFPGSMGVIRIQDGVLVIEDFRSVYHLLHYATPWYANISNTENRLFHNGLNLPWDSDYCPDFERAAYIWSLGYEVRQKESIDGVISMTPSVVQVLLAAMDKEIQLFDGLTLTGENATKVLLYDLYYKYLGRNPVSNGGAITDQLFADAAAKTIDVVMDNMDPTGLSVCLSTAKQCIENRTLMLWMADEGEQAIIRALNWHGGLNTDPEKPQAGVYYNCTVPSKMGWFLVMDPQLGERVRNDDGSYTYPVTVTLSNAMTQEELKAAGSYITGGAGGAIGGSVYFFAPAGGTVSDFSASTGATVYTDKYNGLELGYLPHFRLHMDQPVVVTYHVTTAPGVEAMLTFSQTPTVQAYHR